MFAKHFCLNMFSVMIQVIDKFICISLSHKSVNPSYSINSWKLNTRVNSLVKMDSLYNFDYSFILWSVIDSTAAVFELLSVCMRDPFLCVDRYCSNQHNHKSSHPLGILTWAFGCPPAWNLSEHYSASCSSVLFFLLYLIRIFFSFLQFSSPP